MEKKCRICGCTDDDCAECIESLGHPCAWSPTDESLCTRCEQNMEPVGRLWQDVVLNRFYFERDPKATPTLVEDALDCVEEGDVVVPGLCEEEVDADGE